MLIIAPITVAIVVWLLNNESINAKLEGVNSWLTKKSTSGGRFIRLFFRLLSIYMKIGTIAPDPRVRSALQGGLVVGLPLLALFILWIPVLGLFPMFSATSRGMVEAYEVGETYGREAILDQILAKVPLLLDIEQYTEDMLTINESMLSEFKHDLTTLTSREFEAAETEFFPTIKNPQLLSIIQEARSNVG